jgi:hypothetical protein
MQREKPAENSAKFERPIITITVLYQYLSRWLGRLDSNQGMAESKSTELALCIREHSEKIIGSTTPIGYGFISECREANDHIAHERPALPDALKSTHRISMA